MHRNAPRLPEFDLGMGIHLVLRPTATSPPIPVSVAEEMENLIFQGALAASCTLRLDAAPSDRLLQDLRGNPAILQVSIS